MSYGNQDIGQMYLGWLLQRLGYTQEQLERTSLGWWSELLRPGVAPAPKNFQDIWKRAKDSVTAGDFANAPYFYSAPTGEDSFYTIYTRQQNMFPAPETPFGGQEIAPDLYQWAGGTYTDSQGRPISQPMAQRILSEYNTTAGGGMTPYQQGQTNLGWAQLSFQQQQAQQEAELARQQQLLQWSQSPRDWIQYWMATHQPQPQGGVSQRGEHISTGQLGAIYQNRTGQKPQEGYEQAKIGQAQWAENEANKPNWGLGPSGDSPMGPINWSQQPHAYTDPKSIASYEAAIAEEKLGITTQGFGYEIPSYENWLRGCAGYYQEPEGVVTGITEKEIRTITPRQKMEYGVPMTPDEVRQLKWIQSAAGKTTPPTEEEIHAHEIYGITSVYIVDPETGEGRWRTRPRETRRTAIPPQPTSPPAPEWLPQFVPGLATGQPISGMPTMTPSGQMWAATPYSQQMGLGGYADWAAAQGGSRTMEDIMSEMEMMQPETPYTYGNWRPAYARA